MGESIRKRKTSWDAEEHTSFHVEPNDGNEWTEKVQYSSYRESGDSTTDLSSQNSLPHESHRVSRHGKNVPETEELDRKNDFHRSMSPSFDGRWKQRASRSPDHRSSQSHRHSTRDRSRSRSPSRRRDRARYHVQQRSGNRSRSHTMNASLDYAQERESSKSAKQLCKYFAAGKCRHKNCKFSHDAPTPSYVEIRPSDHIDGCRLDVDNKCPSDPNWEEKLTDGEEQNAASIASQSQRLDGISHAHKQDKMQENSGTDLSSTVMKPEISSNSCVMPYTFDEDSSNFGANMLHEVKNSSNSIHPVSLPGQSYQVGESMILGTEPSDPNSALPTFNAKPNLDQYQASGDGVELRTSGNCMVPLVNSSFLDEQKPKVPLEQLNQLSVVNLGAGEMNEVGGSDVRCDKDPLLKQPEICIDLEANGNNKIVAKKCDDQENKHYDIVEGSGKVEELSGNKDDKAFRLFKNALIEFVKEILKPTWKEGGMSKEVHKTIVKKVVDKVITTVQGDHVPKTQEKIDQYLSCSKAKIAKLVQAYTERCLKANA